MKILVTGAAGFIGFHLCEKLIDLGHEVIGLDNLNDYYDVNLKYARLFALGIHQDKLDNGKLLRSEKYESHFQFIKMDLVDGFRLRQIFGQFQFDAVCNLAAQAGVRYSIEAPQAYIRSNLEGFVNVLECCKDFGIQRLVYASSSSVYGNQSEVPFSEKENVDFPVSMYAATKKSNELMAHVYSDMYGIETIGLRFFTVYGPYGRPDMAIFLFTDAILRNKPIKIFNNGDLSRDFTYIDDIVTGVVKTLVDAPQKNRNQYRIYNIGNSKPVRLLDFVTAIEKATGMVSIKNMMPMQKGDVYKTWADVSELDSDYGYSPQTKIETGIKAYVTWFRQYYGI